jgi:hypothetical protein
VPKSAKRRFVGLDTEEVSLVDSPANEVEFLVVKNTEDPSMSATAAAKKQRVQVETDDDEATTNDDAVAKSLEHVNGIVEKITALVAKGEKPAPDPDSGKGGEEEDDDTQDTDTSDEETLKAAAKSLKSVLAKCGMDAEMSKKVYGSLKAAGFDLTAKGGMPFMNKPKGKGGNDMTDEEKTSKASSGDEPLTMANLALAVQKAAAFTPARIAQLKSAQEILKLVLEAVTPGTSPDSSVPAVQTHGNPSSVADLTKPNTKPSVPTMKSADPEIVTLFKSLSGAVEKLVERVEAIEKARPGSNSLGDQGGTDSAVKKSNMWSGVL